jgi:hypothetical protein
MGLVSSFRGACNANPESRVNGDDMKRLVADFNRDWPDVTRTREIFVLAEEFAR